MHSSAILRLLAVSATLFLGINASPVADRGPGNERGGRGGGGGGRGGPGGGHGHGGGPRPNWPTSTKVQLPGGNCTATVPVPVTTTEYCTITETTTTTTTQLKGYETVTVVKTLPQDTKTVYAGTKTHWSPGPTTTIYSKTKTITIHVPGPTTTKTVVFPGLFTKTTTITIATPGPTTTKTVTKTHTVTLPGTTKTHTVTIPGSIVTTTPTTTTTSTTTTSAAPKCLHTSPILDSSFEGTPENAWTDITHASTFTRTLNPHVGNAELAFQNTSPTVLQAIYFGELTTGNAIRQSIPVCPLTTYAISLRGLLPPSNQLEKVNAVAKVFVGDEKVVELEMEWDMETPEVWGWKEGKGEWTAKEGRWAETVRVEVDIDGEGLRMVVLDDLEMVAKI